MKKTIKIGIQNLNFTLRIFWRYQWSNRRTYNTKVKRKRTKWSAIPYLSIM